MPSIYLGCQIEDEIASSVDLVNQTFKEIEEEADAQLAQLQANLARLSGDKSTAQVVIGEDVNDNRILWSAKEPGIDGNQLKIVYDFKGPDFFAGAFQDRPPSAEAVGTTIYITLAVNAAGSIDPVWDTAASLPVWLSGTGVSDLVNGQLVDAGTGLPEPTELLSFTGGVGAPLTDAEDAANTIAKQFGHNSYQELMRSLDIPIVESEADAAQYLESVDDEIVIINRKLFIVEGTNLVGIRQMYKLLGSDLSKLKDYLEKLNANQLIPHQLTTQNVSTTRYEAVCGELQPITVVTEVYRAYNEPLQTTANKFTSGSVAEVNGYIFWAVAPRTTVQAYNKLSVYGYPDELITDTLEGETPEPEDYFGEVQIPVVNTIVSPTLFDQLGLTNSEIEELLGKEDVPGVRVPNPNDPSDKNAKFKSMIRGKRAVLPNGMRSKVKKPLAALQAVDLKKSGEVGNLTKEMSVRGQACARQARNMGTSKNPLVKAADYVNTFGDDVANQIADSFNSLPKFPSPNLPSLDLPNLPSPSLPDLAKKVESAFGALSTIVDKATGLYDRLVGKTLDTVKSVMNKLQNLSSLVDNLLNNDLTKCLLGSSTEATGQPTVPEVSGGGGIGGGGTGGGGSGSGGGGGLSIGGIPIPTSLLSKALTELNDVLDETITSGVETMMGIIEKPLCMVQSLMDDILGFNLDLGDLNLNPCKDGKNPNNECPPEEVQEIIEESTQLNSDYSKLPQSELFPRTPSTSEVEETIEEFTGEAKKTVTEVTNAVERGITEIMQDITKSINSATDLVGEVTKAIRELTGEDINEGATALEEENETSKGCAPTSIGALTDAITAYI